MLAFASVKWKSFSLTTASLFSVKCGECIKRPFVFLQSFQLSQNGWYSSLPECPAQYYNLPIQCPGKEARGRQLHKLWPLTIDIRAWQATRSLHKLTLHCMNGCHIAQATHIEFPATAKSLAIKL